MYIVIKIKLLYMYIVIKIKLLYMYIVINEHMHFFLVKVSMPCPLTPSTSSWKLTYITILLGLLL